jgi:hypothetical protein
MHGCLKEVKSTQHIWCGRSRTRSDVMDAGNKKLARLVYVLVSE